MSALYSKILFLINQLYSSLAQLITTFKTFCLFRCFTCNVWSFSPDANVNTDSVGEGQIYFHVKCHVKNCHQNILHQENKADLSRLLLMSILCAANILCLEHRHIKFKQATTPKQYFAKISL